MPSDCIVQDTLIWRVVYNQIKIDSGIRVVGQIASHVICQIQLHFLNDEVQYSPELSQTTNLNQQDILFVRNTDLTIEQPLQGFKRIDTDEHYTILQKQ